MACAFNHTLRKDSKETKDTTAELKSLKTGKAKLKLWVNHIKMKNLNKKSKNIIIRKMINMEARE